MIEYAPNKFFVAHWFVDQPSDVYRRLTGVANMNWIAAVWRNPDERYELKYRFAYYDNRERHIRSSWMNVSFESNVDIQKVIFGVDMLAKKVSEQNGGSHRERVDLNLSGDKAIEKLLQKPWMRIIATQAEMN
jgi:hypothetical protein